MNISPFKASCPNIDLIASPESFFDNVKTEFNNYKTNGFYSKDKQAAYYIYTIEVNGRSHSGLIADTHIEDLLSLNKIRKHEKTIVSKEQTMMHLILHRQAMVKPVLLTYPEKKEINKLINRLNKSTKIYQKISFKSNGETHLFKKISDKKLIAEIEKTFAEHLNETYIADGHHRASTMSMLYSNNKVPGAKKKFSKILCAYFPFSQIQIESYNRIVDLTETMSETQFMAKLSQYFTIKVLAKEKRPSKKHCITMYVNQEWYELKWIPKAIKNYPNKTVQLDTALFNYYVLNKILDVEDVRFDTRIGYISGTKGTKGLMKKVNDKTNQIGFCITSVKPEEMVSIVNAGNTLPPKSTWFIPRLRSGFLVKEF